MDWKLGQIYEVAAGPHGIVAITERCKTALDGAPDRAHDQFIAFAHKACAIGFRAMPDTLFKFEGRHRVGGKTGREVAVYAFKPRGLRIYGGVFSMPGVTVFIGTEMVEKKRDKADRKALARAAERVLALQD